MAEDKAEFLFRRSIIPKGEAVTAEEAENYLLRQLKERGGTCKETLWQLTRVQSRMGKHSQALAHIHRLLQLTDDVEENASCFLALGQLAEQTEDFAAAIDYYRGGISLKPTQSSTCYWLSNNIGYCLNMLEKYDEAEAYLRRAIRIAPKMSNAFKNLGLCFQGRGDYGKAAKCFIRALKVNASDARPLEHLEQLVASHPDVLGDIPNLVEQIEVCQKAVELADQARPDWEKHWKELRRKQKSKVSML